jgi:hypothetical protein
MVASVAKCLLGERSLQFFRFRGPRCVGQRDLYPFAILFRELPVDRHEELIRARYAGNYCGEESRIGNEPKDWPVIEGYNDGYPRTSPSPVGSFEVNINGLHDMGGNVWQWCEDWYNTQGQSRGSWNNSNPDYLLASCRFIVTPALRRDGLGFRCVLAVESSQ